MSLKIK